MKKIIICADGTWQSPESGSVTHILRTAPPRHTRSRTGTAHQRAPALAGSIGALLQPRTQGTAGASE